VSALPPVCILTAGMGTRMGLYTDEVNKALLPLDDRAIISHIIERFPMDTEFVVGLGYLHEQVRQYLRIAHPDREITFVDIENFDGPGSGPGLSLSCCRSHLQRPFYFVSCDTLWDGALPMPLDHNWLGVAPVPVEQTDRYCTLLIEADRITELKDKEAVTTSGYQAFVGLCYIHDFDVYWESLDNSDLVAGELQMSTALRGLIEQCDVRPRSIEWTDVGDLEKYKDAVLRYADYDFSKSDEIFFKVGPKIIKYFVDESLAEKRVAKASILSGVFPVITDHSAGFYAYEYQPGETLYQCNSPLIFKNLLKWLEESLWQKADVDKKIMGQACRNFYMDKTLKRLELFNGKYPGHAEPTNVNGQEIPLLEELIDQISWEKLEAGIPSFMHGDLQFDNILFDVNTQTYTLIDWRSDFSGHVEFGDLYYDIAKLRGGIILNYDFIKKGLLTYEEDGASANFDFAQRYLTKVYLDILDEYVLRNSLDLKRVRLLTAIIYLNMSPLHHYPFDKMLHALGRQLLFLELSEVE
jgi:dTDP-glucose pyrophosphorylase